MTLARSLQALVGEGGVALAQGWRPPRAPPAGPPRYVCGRSCAARPGRVLRVAVLLGLADEALEIEPVRASERTVLAALPLPIDLGLGAAG